MKETQEGCLSRSIIKFFEHFHTFDLFEKLASACRQDFVDTLIYGVTGTPYIRITGAALAFQAAAPHANHSSMRGGMQDSGLRDLRMEE